MCCDTDSLSQGCAQPEAERCTPGQQTNPVGHCPVAQQICPHATGSESPESTHRGRHQLCGSEHRTRGSSMWTMTAGLSLSLHQNLQLARAQHRHMQAQRWPPPHGTDGTNFDAHELRTKCRQKRSLEARMHVETRRYPGELSGAHLCSISGRCCTVRCSRYPRRASARMSLSTESERVHNSVKSATMRSMRSGASRPAGNDCSAQLLAVMRSE